MWLRNKSNLDELADDALITRFRQDGDMKAVGILFNRYIDLVYGVCLKYLKSSVKAEDAVMHIFELIVKKLPKHQVENFRPWLHVVSKNHCLEHLRKNKKKLTVGIDPDFMQSDAFVHHDDEFEFNGQHDSLYDCINQLPNKQKKSIELFYLESKSYQEIAEMTGVEKEKVRSFIQNGRRNLKICMEKKNGQAK